MIAFFHTLKSNIEKFEVLTADIAPDAEIKHFVNESILPEALQAGEVTPKIFQEFETEIKAISTLNPEQIICTCSTFGEACKMVSKQGIKVNRIDYPIAEYLVKNYKKIGLAFAAASTQKISTNLLHEISNKLKKEIEIIPIDCTSSWSHFTSKQTQQYHKTIAETISIKHRNVDAVFLAQASMESAKDFLTIDTEVVASPVYGVKYYLQNN